MTSKKCSERKRPIILIFGVLDPTGTSFTTITLPSQVVTQLGSVLTSAEADEFMREADLNGDGKLDYDEFVKMMMSDSGY